MLLKNGSNLAVIADLFGGFLFLGRLLAPETRTYDTYEEKSRALIHRLAE
jgi:hypothetical protein